MSDKISVVIPTSYIPSLPSTAIIEETIHSVRHHLSNVPIYIMLDGLREEQAEHTETYLDYLHALSAKVMFSDWKNIKIAPFFTHMHQSGMMRMILQRLATPLLLFVEHDTPLVTDESIPWKELSALVDDGDVNLVRLLHEAHIHPEHEHLMHGRVEGVMIPLTKTTQFSARPHLTSTLFYSRLLSHFSPNANCFIEDKAHGICQDAPWEEWKLSIYTPEGNCKRSYHTDGRAGGNKFDESQVF